MDEDGGANSWVVVTFHPSQFECRVCGLELDGEDEIGAAGVPESWQLEDVDESDFVEDWSYDDY